MARKRVAQASVSSDLEPPSVKRKTTRRTATLEEDSLQEEPVPTRVHDNVSDDVDSGDENLKSETQTTGGPVMEMSVKNQMMMTHQMKLLTAPIT